MKTRGTKEQPCRFAGLSPDQPDAWRIYDPQRDIFFDSAHVAFDESEFEEPDFDVRKSLASPKSIKNDEKLNSKIVNNSDFFSHDYLESYYRRIAFDLNVAE